MLALNMVHQKVCMAASIFLDCDAKVRIIYGNVVTNK